MALSPRIDLRQTQQLRLTPQLRQAIALLQMTNLELGAHLRDEADQNPLLELETNSPNMTPAADPTPAEAQNTGLAPDGQGFENLYQDPVSDLPYRPDRDRPLADITAAGPVSLQDNLRQQIRLSDGSKLHQEAALLLINDLNEDGFLDTPLFSLSEQWALPLPLLEEGLALLQRCEPTGIAARSLAECLQLQLAERGLLKARMRMLTENLPLVASGRLDALRKMTGLRPAELGSMIAVLQGLNPRPATTFDADQAAAVIPDVFIRKSPEGAWNAELNTETLPRVLINNDYAAELGDQKQDVRLYISECRQKANWITRAVEQRARTILKVVSEILRHQAGFFEDGPSALKPLTLREVATEIDMHESTVSRVTANKYLHCPFGTFELRYFFSASVSGTGQDTPVAATAVQARIKALIAAEDPKKILSDDKIVAMLKDEGVDVARRTVAKYREGMSIPSSVLRRRQKAGFTGR